MAMVEATAGRIDQASDRLWAFIMPRPLRRELARSSGFIHKRQRMPKRAISMRLMKAVADANMTHFL
jgi:hypothetical protein